MDCASAKVYLQMEGGIKKNKVPQGLKMRKDGDSTQIKNDRGSPQKRCNRRMIGFWCHS